MSVRSKIRIPLALSWAACFLLILFVVWWSGFIYWRIAVNRAILDLRHDTPARLNSSNPPSPLLHHAGSRATPALLQAMTEATHWEDRELANLLYRVHVDTLLCSCYVDPPWTDTTLGWDLTPEMCSMKFLTAVAKDESARWEQRKKDYPPWWMWWRGRRRTP